MPLHPVSFTLLSDYKLQRPPFIPFHCHKSIRDLRTFRTSPPESGGIKSYESHRVSNSDPPPSPASLRPSLPLVDTFNQEEASRTFTCFTRLPSELQLKIWNDALPCTRVIDLNLCVTSKGYFVGYEPPVLLSVCRESRNLVQK